MDFPVLRFLDWIAHLAGARRDAPVPLHPDAMRQFI
jgi:hypothetical protein